MTLEALLDRLDGVRREGDQYVARCPGHQDRRPSLFVGEREGRLLVYDRSQHCRPEAIVRALGLELRDLFTAPSSRPTPPRRPASPIVEARQNIRRDALRQPWAREGVVDAYRLADALRAARHRAREMEMVSTGAGDSEDTWRLTGQASNLASEVLAVEDRLEARQAAETWARGLEAVAALLAEYRDHRGWRGFSPGHGGWLARYGVMA